MNDDLTDLTKKKVRPIRGLSKLDYLGSVHVLQPSIFNLMPSFYHRFVDDSITSQRNIASAEAFLSTLNSLHPSPQFTMELEIDGLLPFLGTTLIYIQPTNTGLMLHYESLFKFSNC